MPILDYRLDVQNPVQAALAGYTGGQQNVMNQQKIAMIEEERQRQAVAAAQAQQQQQAQQEKQLRLQQAMVEFGQKENKTPQDYIKFLEANPELTNMYKGVFDMRQQAQQQQDVINAQTVFNAIRSGNKDVALKELDLQIQALKNSGMADQARALENIKAQYEMNPAGAELSIGNYLAAVAPEQFAKNYEIMQEQKRAEELQPGAVAKQDAELRKMGIDAGLTEAEIEKRISETNKLDAETRRLLMEIEGESKGGIVDPVKRSEVELKIGDKYYSRTGNYQEMLTTYENLLASAKQGGGPADLALITAFMKMLDPGSVVRETEFANARDTAGFYNNLKNRISKWKEGDFLQPEQRQEFVDLAKKYMDAAKKHEASVRDQLMQNVENYGLNPENVFPKERKITPSDIMGTPPSTGGQVQLPSGVPRDLKIIPIDERLQMLRGQ